MKKNIKIIILFNLVIFLSSCAVTIAPPPQRHPPRPAAVTKPVPIMTKNVVHIVAPGETVWRIGKMYGVDVKNILKKNNLDNSNKIKMGQKLVIPHASPIKAVIPFYKSKKWKYIIVHHSATDEGNALFFNAAHLRRGFNRGVGYHFVIDNGTKGKKNGQIEVTPRWLKQQDGAHCRASRRNKDSIGICLVGNFSKERVSEKQLASLVRLVKKIKKYYKIPLKNIMGHGQVPNARTECPGKHFPWTVFKNRLK